MVYWLPWGVMQQRVGFGLSPDRHHQGVSDELRRRRCTHRANHAPREEIDDIWARRTRHVQCHGGPALVEDCDPSGQVLMSIKFGNG